MNKIKKAALAVTTLSFFAFSGAAEAQTVRGGSPLTLTYPGYTFSDDVPGKIKLGYDSQTAQYFRQIVNGNGGLSTLFPNGLTGDLICEYNNNSNGGLQSRRVQWQNTQTKNVSIPTTNLEKCTLQIDPYPDGETFTPILAPFSAAAKAEAALNVEIIRDQNLALESADGLRLFKADAFTTATRLQNYTYLNDNDPSDYYDYRLGTLDDVDEQDAIWVLPSSVGVVRFGQLLLNGKKLVTRATATETTYSIVD